MWPGTSIILKTAHEGSSLLGEAVLLAALLVARRLALPRAVRPSTRAKQTLSLQCAGRGRLEG